MVALPGGQQNGRGKGTGKTNESHGHGVLQQRNRRGESTDEAQHDKRRTRRQKLVQPKRCEHGQVEHTHTRPLQGQRIGQTIGLTHMQLPTKHKQCDASSANRSQAQLGRQHGVVDGVLGQKRQADKQHQHAHAHNRVAAEQPVARYGNATGQEVWCHGGGVVGQRLGRVHRVVGCLHTRHGVREITRFSLHPRWHMDACSNRRMRLSRGHHGQFLLHLGAGLLAHFVAQGPSGKRAQHGPKDEPESGIVPICKIAQNGSPDCTP